MSFLTSLVRIGNALIVAALSTMPIVAWGAQIAFDLPSSIECHDISSKEFACAHPNLKTIEGKFRISAWMIEGTSVEILDFVYTLKTNETMRVQDYTPNTTLESAVVEDHIEITDAKEDSTAGAVDGHIAYKPLNLGGSHNQTSKKSEASHYKQIAAKDTVLSSGTIDREHGVIFRIRPSRTAALEGAKEFTFVAVVPKSWRGDLCTISCAARMTKRTMLSTSVVSVGLKQAQIGMYLSPDAECAALADELRTREKTYEDLLAKAQTKGNVFQTISTQASGLLTGAKSQQRKKLQEVEEAVLEIQNRLKQLAK
jgi:hypothetical protein